MIRTKYGIIVKPRKSGNSISLSMPKILGLNSNVKYIATTIQTKNGKGVTYVPLRKTRDPFNVKGLNHTNYVKSMKRNRISLDNGKTGREL